MTHTLDVTTLGYMKMEAGHMGQGIQELEKARECDSLKGLPERNTD